MRRLTSLSLFLIFFCNFFNWTSRTKLSSNKYWFSKKKRLYPKQVPLIEYWNGSVLREYPVKSFLLQTNHQIIVPLIALNKTLIAQNKKILLTNSINRKEVNTRTCIFFVWFTDLHQYWKSTENNFKGLHGYVMASPPATTY